MNFRIGAPDSPRCGGLVISLYAQWRPIVCIGIGGRGGGRGMTVHEQCPVMQDRTGRGTGEI